MPRFTGPTYYTIELDTITWTVPERYKDLELIGNGTFGAVARAVDTFEGRPVAIKKIAQPIANSFRAAHTYREIRILRQIDMDNIIDMLDLFTPDGGPDSLKEIYMVSSLMGADLHHILQMQSLSDDHIRYITYQILVGLRYLHSADIIHRDLKPNNIGVNENCRVRILDFGLARPMDKKMSAYVAMRWYRAPEIMYNWTQYNQTADIWSVGCILGEMINRRPLFPGTGQVQQFWLICRALGRPGETLVNKMISTSARAYIRSFKPEPDHNENGGDLERLLPTSTSPETIEVLRAMLSWDPDERVTADAALDLPYFASFRQPDYEPTTTPVDIDFDNQDAGAMYTLPEWKGAIWNEIQQYSNGEICFSAPTSPRDSLVLDPISPAAHSNNSSSSNNKNSALSSPTAPNAAMTSEDAGSTGSSSSPTTTATYFTFPTNHTSSLTRRLARLESVGKPCVTSPSSSDDVIDAAEQDTEVSYSWTVRTDDAGRCCSIETAQQRQEESTDDKDPTSPHGRCSEDSGTSSTSYDDDGSSSDLTNGVADNDISGDDTSCRLSSSSSSMTATYSTTALTTTTTAPTPPSTTYSSSGSRRRSADDKDDDSSYLSSRASSMATTHMSSRASPMATTHSSETALTTVVSTSPTTNPATSYSSIRWRSRNNAYDNVSSRPSSTMTASTTTTTSPIKPSSKTTSVASYNMPRYRSSLASSIRNSVLNKYAWRPSRYRIGNYRATCFTGTTSDDSYSGKSCHSGSD